jgi:hypothetical protein
MRRLFGSKAQFGAKYRNRTFLSMGPDPSSALCAIIFSVVGVIVRDPDAAVLANYVPSGFGLINVTKLSPSFFTTAKSSCTIISRYSAVLINEPNTNMSVCCILPNLSRDAL